MSAKEEETSGLSGKVKKTLENVAIGQHNLIMFHEGQQSYSSVCGGITTLFFFLFLTAYGTLITVRTLSREHYNLERAEIPISLDSYKLSEM